MSLSYSYRHFALQCVSRLYVYYTFIIQVRILLISIFSPLNYTGHKDLKDKCPEDVRALLEEKDLFDVYDKFVQTIVDTKNTRGATGKWQDAQFISILDQFRDDFTAKGIKICFCKRKSGSKVGSYRWLEFLMWRH